MCNCVLETRQRKPIAKYKAKVKPVSWGGGGSSCDEPICYTTVLWFQMAWSQVSWLDWDLTCGLIG